MELEELKIKRHWMYNTCSSLEFAGGVDGFITLATSNHTSGSEIRCPCTKCRNRKYNDPETIRDHLYWKGFTPDYYCWTSHGESIIEKTPMRTTNKQTDGLEEIQIKMQEMQKQLENITVIVQNLEAQLSQFVQQQQAYALTQPHPQEQEVVRPIEEDSGLSIYDHNLTFKELLNVAINGGEAARAVFDSYGVAGEHKGLGQGSLEG